MSLLNNVNKLTNVVDFTEGKYLLGSNLVTA